MHHPRRDHQGSAFSRPSTYSESSALPKEETDLDQLEHPEISGFNLTTFISGPVGPAPSRETSTTSHHPQQQQVVQFADELVQKSPTQLACPDPLAAVSRNRKGGLQRKGIDLMSRLYDRPENSHVLRTVRANEAQRRTQEKGSPGVGIK